MPTISAKQIVENNKRNRFTEVQGNILEIMDMTHGGSMHNFTEAIEIMKKEGWKVLAITSVPSPLGATIGRCMMEKS